MSPLHHGLVLMLGLTLSAGADGVALKLVSDTRTITPGKAFTVGLHLQHKKGFHTYWKSPGIVGLPTALTWELPAGFTASEIQWPYPEKTLMAGHPCHGYERDVTLLVTITPPAILPEGKVTLKTSAQWMACATQCFPGFQDFSITFPRETANDPQLIKKAKAELPKKSADLKATLLSKKDDPIIKILLKGPFPAEDVYFFSSDGQVSSDQAQKLTRLDHDTVSLTLQRSETSPEAALSLPGVLQIGKRHLAIAPIYLR